MYVLQRRDFDVEVGVGLGEVNRRLARASPGQNPDENVLQSTGGGEAHLVHVLPQEIAGLSADLILLSHSTQPDEPSKGVFSVDGRHVPFDPSSSRVAQG